MLRLSRNWSALAVTVVTLALLSLTGCNTAEGFGRDVQKAGEAIEKEAQE